MTEERDNKGKFQKGVSGNYAGRPKGSTNKALTNKQIQERLGKGDGTALNVLMEDMLSEDGDKRTRSAMKWIDVSLKFRELMYKMQADVKKAKSKSSEEDTQEDESQLAPVISFEAIKK